MFICQKRQQQHTDGDNGKTKYWYPGLVFQELNQRQLDQYIRKQHQFARENDRQNQGQVIAIGAESERPSAKGCSA